MAATAKTVKLLGILGSLRRASYNRGLMRAATEVVPQDATLEVFELHGIPPFNQDEEQNSPERVKQLKAKVRAADAILFVTPEYNYSVPGVLKNAIDWASRPYGDNAFDGKPAAIAGASIGALGTARAQYHLRQSAVFLNMHVLNRPEVMVANAAQRFDAQGNLIDAKTRELLGQLLSHLVEFTRKHWS